MDNPEPTEEEHELAGTDRHVQEDDMRGYDAQRDSEPEDEPEDE